MKLGLKLWSTNTGAYFDEAQKLYRQGFFDYIELYVVPDTTRTIEKWKILEDGYGIPLALHAPHFMNGVNLADSSKEEYNLNAFKQVNRFSDELNAQYVVVHSGIEGNIDETIRQLKIIRPEKMLIENKPYAALLKDNKECRGAVIDEIKKVIEEIGCGFCLDIGHSFCCANSLNINPYEYLKEFNKLNPSCYHLSDNFIDSTFDKHYHLGEGNYDFKKIFDIIDTSKNVTIETNKNSKENLDDFIEDVKWIRSLR